MEAHNEKKWFVYVGDHHEGPFSVSELLQKTHSGQVTPASYVWAEGMADWRVITEVSPLQSLFHHAQPHAPIHAADPVLPTLQTIEEPSAADAFASPQLEEQPKVQLAMQTGHNERSEADRIALGTIGDSAGNTSFAPLDMGAPARPRLPIKLIAFLVVVAGGAVAYSQGYVDTALKSPAARAGTQAIQDFAQPLLLKLSDKIPALGNWVSPIPRLDDVSPEEYAALQAAARARLAETGPKIAIALSRSDVISPVFHVASNLPDGAKIDVYAEGVPDSLLNQLAFDDKVSTVISRKHGTTTALKFPDGKPLPRGQMYNVYAVESEDQPQAVKDLLAPLQPANVRIPGWMPRGPRLVAAASYFLGGNKDATYAARLKEFHDRLREKATNELNEVRQFTDTLDSQLQLTRQGFEQAGKTRNKAQRARNWDELNRKWTALENQVDASLAKWTPESLQKDYFYGTLYQMVQQTGASVVRLHQLHNAFMTGASTDAKAFEIQRGQANAEATSNMASLRAKIEQATRIEPTPNGMPRKEGL